MRTDFAEHLTSMTFLNSCDNYEFRDTLDVIASRPFNDTQHGLLYTLTFRRYYTS